MEFLRYLLVSALALSLDYLAYFIILLNDTMGLPSAAVCGYVFGMLVAYFFMSNKVFRYQRPKTNKVREIILFMISGFIGIIVTYLTVWYVASVEGADAFVSKGVAVVLSFFSVYMFRKFIVFAPYRDHIK